jgi:hypothetical protein
MRDVIATVFFSSKIDPQRFVKYSPNFDYIEKWYNCVKELDVDVIIFHDALSDELVQEKETDNIKFVKVIEFNSQAFCAADYRWVLYSNYFSNNFYEKIFVTDCSDVLINKSPFEFIDEDNIYIGVECSSVEKGLVDVIGESPWCRGVYSYAYKDFPYWDKKILNCGIVGGCHNNFMKLVNAMKDEIIRIDPSEEECSLIKIPYTIDMAVLAYVSYGFFDGKIVSGEPLHSKYKFYEIDRKDVYFIHK